MALVIFAPEMLACTGMQPQLEVEAHNYRAALREIQSHFPDLDDALLARFAVAIDDTVINSPLLERLEPDSEMIFIPRIAGG